MKRETAFNLNLLVSFLKSFCHYTTGEEGFYSPGSEGTDSANPAVWAYATGRDKLAEDNPFFQSTPSTS